ncbi:MAG TPA: helix-turn-helix domain-containing protein [Solirubrobacterales bacterium]|nr:helix-turn-helix domain-containing protein [Solirubrobacterales bacterium]
MPISPTVERILARLRLFREEAGLSAQELEERLILGPGWIHRFEAGEAVPALDVLIAILHEIGRTAGELFTEIEADASAGSVARSLFAESVGEDLVLQFDYADHEASYRLKSASLEEFESVLRVLRDGLAGEQQKSNAVVASFELAVRRWPHANPSDLWWFLIYRAYLDPFNHPAAEARRNFHQSWVRTGGWALERVLVSHYGPFLRKHGIEISIPLGDEKELLVGQLDVPSRLEPDKVDVVLSATGKDGRAVCFGVVHVKASFAERRTDDVELSKALIDAGYCSPFWTMDCKSTPSENPVNRGELGQLLGEMADSRSAKRKDFEVDGFFSACFSYNSRTKPTPQNQENVTAPIYVCDFRDSNDAFAAFVRAEWTRFKMQAD